MARNQSIPREPVWSVLLLLNRLAVGWYMVHASLGKVKVELEKGPGSFFRGESYQGMTPAWVPEWLSMIHGYALPWMELIPGALLILGLFTRTAAGLLFLVALSIAIAVFGQGELFPRHQILFFLTILPVMFFYGAGRYGVDTVLGGKEKGAASE